jgi:hypothetical protein
LKSELENLNDVIEQMNKEFIDKLNNLATYDYKLGKDYELKEKKVVKKSLHIRICNKISNVINRGILWIKKLIRTKVS